MQSGNYTSYKYPQSVIQSVWTEAYELQSKRGLNGEIVSAWIIDHVEVPSLPSILETSAEGLHFLQNPQPAIHLTKKNVSTNESLVHK